MPISANAAAQLISPYGDPVLHRRCAPVRKFDQALDELIDTMFASMHALRGLGLAANQIGADARVFVLNCPDLESGEFTVAHVVNPVLELPAPPRQLEVRVEGCLSIPGASAELPRCRTAAVIGRDRAGRPIRIEGRGLVARCLQHECDHLDGLTYPDRLPGPQRRRLLAGSGNRVG